MKYKEDLLMHASRLVFVTSKMKRTLFPLLITILMVTGCSSSSDPSNTSNTFDTSSEVIAAEQAGVTYLNVGYPIYNTTFTRLYEYDMDAVPPWETLRGEGTFRAAQSTSMVITTWIQ
jgi:hypothetical protein